MSKSAGSGEFNAAVCRKQSPFKQTQRYMQEKERIWLLILLYDHLLLLMETQNFETVANETLMVDEQPEGTEGPWWNPASPTYRASAKDSGFPKAIVVTWCFKALRCCWWNEFGSGFVMEKRFKLKKLFLQVAEPYGLRQETFKISHKAHRKLEQVTYFRRLD